MAFARHIWADNKIVVQNLSILQNLMTMQQKTIQQNLLQWSEVIQLQRKLKPTQPGVSSSYISSNIANKFVHLRPVKGEDDLSVC